jgi:hypothetical protein
MSYDPVTIINLTTISATGLMTAQMSLVPVVGVVVRIFTFAVTNRNG